MRFLAGIVAATGGDEDKARARATLCESATYSLSVVRGVSEQQPEQDVNGADRRFLSAFDSSGQPTRAALAFAESCGTTGLVAGPRAGGQGRIPTLQYARKPGSPHQRSGARRSAGSARRVANPQADALGAGNAGFVRPVHWVVLLFGKDVVPASILGVSSDRFTRGHRFHAPKTAAYHPRQVRMPEHCVSADGCWRDSRPSDASTYGAPPGRSRRSPERRAGHGRCVARRGERL